MQAIISSFQAELLQKIQFKTFSNVSLDAYLFKNFKFFDLHLQGALGRSDFFRAIAKCGVVVDSENMDGVYQHYAGEDGLVHYREFIERLLFKEEPEGGKVEQREEPQDRRLEASKKEKEQQLEESRIDRLYNKCETYQEVLDFVRKSLPSGLGSLLTLAVQLKSADPQRRHTLNKTSIQAQAPFLRPQHLELIFSELSQNGQEIQYSVFIYDLKGELEEHRAKQIQAVFNELDTRREGEFPINYFVGRYLSKRDTPAFTKAVELYSRFQGIDDGVFTQDDFFDFMGFLSSDCISQEQFRLQLIRPFYQEDTISVLSHKSNRSRDFSIREGSQAQSRHSNRDKEKPLEEKDFNQEPQEKYEQKKSMMKKSEVVKEVSTQKMREIESIILRIKKRLASKGSKGFLFFQKGLRGADTDRDGLLSYDEFQSVIKQQRIDITSTQSNHIFKVFDETGSQLIDYSQLMFALRGNIPQSRKGIVQKICQQVCKDGESTSFGLIKKRLNFRNHPDVQNARKYEDDIWKELQETLLTIQDLNGTGRKDTVTRSEFEEYIEHLSLSTIDDKLFQTILLHFWRLENSANITEKYAGSRKVFNDSKLSYLMDHHRYAVQGGSVAQNAPFGTSFEPTTYTTQHRRL